MSTLSELTPSGGSGKGVKFVASGALSNGSTVVLKSDGTVEIVGESSSSVSENIPSSSKIIFNNASTEFTSVAFDPNNENKIVITYMDKGNSSYGTAIVGTISGTGITFGTPVVYISGGSYYNSMAFDPSSTGKFVVAFKESTGQAVVGTISGTSITFGSVTAFNPDISRYVELAFDPNTPGQFVVIYRDDGNSQYGTAVVGTISGTSLSFGSEAVFNSGIISEPGIDFDPNTAGKFVVVFEDRGGSRYGKSIVGTVSGTTITYGSLHTFAATQAYTPEVSFDSNTANTFVVTYKDGLNSEYGTVMVGTLSGSTFTFGSASVFNSVGTHKHIQRFNSQVAGQFIVVYSDNWTNGHIRVGSISGYTVTFGSAILFDTGYTPEISAGFDPYNAGRFIVTWMADNNLSKGKCILGQTAATVTSTNLTSTNFLGISDKAYADTATATVTLKGGISTNQSSLTVGSDYYVQSNGTLSTTSSSVKAGKAMNATTLKLTGE